MAFPFDTTKIARIAGVTTQNSDTRLPLGDSSGGTFTAVPNQLKASLFWDRAMYVLTNVAVAGGATGGSYTVTLQTDAIAGFTGLPIARATLGPNSTTRVVMDNLHNSAASPLPTHIFIDQTATGGGLTLNCFAYSKQYRGNLTTRGARSSQRVLEGIMETVVTLSADRTDAISARGTTANFMGLDQFALCDNAMFWFVAGETVSGTWDADVVATAPNGATFSVATTGAAGAVSAAGDKVALASNFYGQCPTPSHIIWTEGSAGGISDARLVMIAKGGRGSRWNG